MSDPIRWSEDGDASELERELLSAGQSVKLPEGERRALWASIALSLPATPPLTGHGAGELPRALGGATRAYLTKGAIFLAAVGGLTWGASQLTPQRAPVAVSPPRPALVMPPAAAAPATATTPSATAWPQSAPVTLSSEPPVNEARPRTSTVSQLREESRVVLEARAALRGGDAARSLALLEQARSRFPRGMLGQEREALTIEALAGTGQLAAARRRAAAFLRAHPQSPYSVDVRRVSER